MYLSLAEKDADFAHKAILPSLSRFFLSVTEDTHRKTYQILALQSRRPLSHAFTWFFFFFPGYRNVYKKVTIEWLLEGDIHQINFILFIHCLTICSHLINHKECIQVPLTLLVFHVSALSDKI